MNRLEKLKLINEVLAEGTMNVWIGDVLDWMDKNKEHLSKVYCPRCESVLHRHEAQCSHP